MIVFRPDTSFPFLAFARKYGLDYGTILRAAEQLERGEVLSIYSFPAHIYTHLMALVTRERLKREKV